MESQNRQEKLNRLYAVYEQPMYRIAYAILHQPEQAEDAVSEAFLRILRNLHKIGDIDSDKTKHYITGIIRSTAINQYRKNQRDAEHYAVWDDAILQNVPNRKNDIEKLLADMVQEQAIAELLEPLSETDQEIVLLRCREELPFREIAQRLSIREATARKRFERAKKVLQEQKGAQYHETKQFSVSHG